MADIAKISGHDAPSGGGASEPTSGLLTLGGPFEQNNALRHGGDDKGTFQEVTFHSTVSHFIFKCMTDVFRFEY